jgi:hypothetical protein
VKEKRQWQSESKKAWRISTLQTSYEIRALYIKDQTGHRDIAIRRDLCKSPGIEYW